MIIISNSASIDLQRHVSVQVFVLIVDSDQLIDVLLVHSVDFTLRGRLSGLDWAVIDLFAHN